METTNTIVDFITFKEQNITYIGLQEASDKAFKYIVDGYFEGQPISEIIKNMHMSENLGYTLHPHSFVCALNIILNGIAENSVKSHFVADINKMDDLGLFCVNKGSTEIVLTENFTLNYLTCEMKHNPNGITPHYDLFIPTPEPTTVPIPEEIKQEDVLTATQDPKEQIRQIKQINVPTDPISAEPTSVTQAPAPVPEASVEPLVVPKDTYITLPAKDPEPNHPDESGGISLEFDDHNKQILLYTVLAFIAIRAIAYYYKNDSEKSSDEDIVENEALNSAYEPVYLDLVLVSNIVLSLIPIWLVITYKLRYYYYYKFLRFKKKIEDGNY